MNLVDVQDTKGVHIRILQKGLGSASLLTLTTLIETALSKPSSEFWTDTKPSSEFIQES